jgi:uncharacterized DUF497 family protein
MDVEWEVAAAASNSAKHGVSSEETATALLDPAALAHDDTSAESEARRVLAGLSAARDRWVRVLR